MSVDDLEDNLAIEVSDNEAEEKTVLPTAQPKENTSTPKRKLEDDNIQKEDNTPKKSKKSNNASNNLSTDPEFIKNFATLPLEQVVQYFNVNLKKADDDKPFLFSKNDFKDTALFPVSERKLTNFNKFLTTFINQKDSKTNTIIVSPTNIRVADIHRAIHLDSDKENICLKAIKLFNKNKLKQDIDTIVDISKNKDKKYKNVKNYISTPTRLLSILEKLNEEKSAKGLWLQDKSKLDIVIDCQFMINSQKNVNVLNDYQTVYKLLDLLRDLKQSKGNSLRIVLY